MTTQALLHCWNECMAEVMSYWRGWSTVRARKSPATLRGRGLMCGSCDASAPLFLVAGVTYQDLVVFRTPHNERTCSPVIRSRSV